MVAIAARARVLWGKKLGVVVNNAHAVVERLGGAECPAAAAIGLIANVANDARAPRPVSSGVKRGRNSIGDISQDRQSIVLCNLLWCADTGSEEPLDILLGGVDELLVHSCCPAEVTGIDRGDHLRVTKGESVR